jgi:signal transduction histidine kinase/ActR/RegA family two-component response regulator
MLSAGATLGAAVLGLSTVLGVVLLGLVRRGVSIQLTGNIMVGSLVATCAAISIARGGVGTPVTAGVCIAVLLAVLACGIRSGLTWFSAVVVLILIDAGFQLTGSAFPDQIPAEHRFLVDLSATLVIPAVVFCVGVAFELAKSAALREQIEAETERQKAEHIATLAESERLATLGTLTAGIGHEINNPLSYVFGNLEMLREELESQEEQRGMIDATLSGVEQIRDIVREMMTYVRADGGGHLRMMEVSQSLRTATVLSQSTLKNLADFRTDCQPTPPVLGSPHRLAQVLINLLVNACQACAEAPDQPGRVVARLFQAGDTVVLEVEDNGVGISPESKSRIFNPFFTTKQPGEGTGLGLSVSTRIVEDMNGTLTVDSRPGRTVFRIELPVAATNPGLPPLELRTLTRRVRLLIVDDDARIAQTLEAMLKTRHDVASAVGGEQALSILRTDSSWDALLIDVLMPGINGVDLMDALEAETPPLSRLPIVFMTGGINDASLRRRVLESARPLIAKPMNLHEVEDAIARAIDTTTAAHPCS